MNILASPQKKPDDLSSQTVGNGLFTMIYPCSSVGSSSSGGFPVGSFPGLVSPTDSEHVIHNGLSSAVAHINDPVLLAKETVQTLSHNHRHRSTVGVTNPRVPAQLIPRPPGKNGFLPHRLLR
jgi:hypothetical protein